jgi:hypothetical protein
MAIQKREQLFITFLFTSCTFYLSETIRAAFELHSNMITAMKGFVTAPSHPSHSKQSVDTRPKLYTAHPVYSRTSSQKSRSRALKTALRDLHRRAKPVQPLVSLPFLHFVDLQVKS